MIFLKTISCNVQKAVKQQELKTETTKPKDFAEILALAATLQAVSTLRTSSDCFPNDIYKECKEQLLMRQS